MIGEALQIAEGLHDGPEYRDRKEVTKDTAYPFSSHPLLTCIGMYRF
jgi:hypothetical protein